MEGASAVDQIRAAVNQGSAESLATLAGLQVPDRYRGVVVRADEADMFAGLATRDKDPRKSLHLQEVPTPEVGPGEALIALLKWRGELRHLLNAPPFRCMGPPR